MNILVTGGTGFIGSNLLKKLFYSQQFDKIIVLKRKVSDISKIESIKNKLILVDIENIDNFDVFFKTNKIDLIIHLSSKYIKYNETDSDIEEMNYFNINFPSKLLYYAAKNNVKAFINTGSFFEYKHSNKKINENDIVEPFNYYSATKIAFEEILKYFSKEYGVRAITLKLFSPYGIGQENKIISLIIKSVIKGKNLSLTSGKQKLSFTYIDDIVQAYINAIDYVISKKYSSYEVFNIGSDKSYSIKEVVAIACNLHKNPPEFIFGDKDMPSREIMVSNCDNSKAEKILGWKPKVGIKEGIKKTFENS